jgi:hypothetical protein
MEIKIADGFLEGWEPGYIHQQTRCESIQEQKYAEYLPPPLIHIVLFNCQGVL